MIATAGATHVGSTILDAPLWVHFPKLLLWLACEANLIVMVSLSEACSALASRVAAVTIYQPPMGLGLRTDCRLQPMSGTVARKGMCTQLGHPAHLCVLGAQIVKNRQLEASVHAHLRSGITADSCFATLSRTCR